MPSRAVESAQRGAGAAEVEHARARGGGEYHEQDAGGLGSDRRCQEGGGGVCEGFGGEEGKVRVLIRIAIVDIVVVDRENGLGE